MPCKLYTLGPLILVLGFLASPAHPPQIPPVSQQPPPAQQSEVTLIIGDSIGTPPRFAVPDFIASSDDPETIELARTLAQVLWDDLEFEREFYMIPRDIYETIPPATSMLDVPFDRWREVGADGVVVGSVQKMGDMVQVRVRLFNSRGQEVGFRRAYTGSAKNPRLYAHTIVSFIYEGRLERPGAGSADQQNWLPAWSPDGTQLAFTSNRDGNPELYLMNSDGGDLRRLTYNPAIDTSPTWSPTGTQLAFTSDRSGRPQIYVIGVDGTGIRRMTFESYCDRPTWSRAPFNEIAYSSRTGPGHDIKILEIATGVIRQLTFGLGTNESPTFAPNVRHLAFTSNRTGEKQIFTIARDGRNLRRVTRIGNNEMSNWSY